MASVRSMVERFLPTELVRVASADPRRLELGGEIAEVTVMFADLGGYSTYAEQRAPSEVVGLLNRYFAAALPAILAEGGTPMQLPGDAVFAVFGAPVARADHAARACRAAMAILASTAPFAAGPMGGPRFAIGLNSGPALVGNIGSEEFRKLHGHRRHDERGGAAPGAGRSRGDRRGARDGSDAGCWLGAVAVARGLGAGPGQGARRLGGGIPARRASCRSCATGRSRMTGSMSRLVPRAALLVHVRLA